MSIKVLQPHVIKQIAAGEIVTRPAAVVKELIENSLDACAKNIEINIKCGGMKSIQIYDNGEGIRKEELRLALTRYATSKVSTLDDLENISTLGFRGEALASISTVSRLKLTSRPYHQEMAWEIYFEQSEINSDLTPVARTFGTTVEVVDLFYNLPARRRFMRTEKTEFLHIEEIVRQLALANSDVSIFLKHNEKIIRRYGARKLGMQYRIKEVIGPKVFQSALFINRENKKNFLFGWVTHPEAIMTSANMTGKNYLYVNGRIVKDNAVTNTIRRAYEKGVMQKLIPAFILYLKIDPREINVNVHPTKHKIQFYQPRIVHNFIYNSILSEVSRYNTKKPKLEKKLATTQSQFYVENQPDTEENSFFSDMKIIHYQKKFGTILTVVREYTILEKSHSLLLFSLEEARFWFIYYSLKLKRNLHFFTVPKKISVKDSFLKNAKEVIPYLNQIGIEILLKNNTIVVISVPLLIKRQDWKECFLDLLFKLIIKKVTIKDEIIKIFVCGIMKHHITWDIYKAARIIAHLENICPHFIVNPPINLLKKINLKKEIEILEKRIHGKNIKKKGNYFSNRNNRFRKNRLSNQAT